MKHREQLQGLGAQHDANTKRAYDDRNHKYVCKNTALPRRLHHSIGNSVLPSAPVGSLLLHSSRSSQQGRGA